MQYVRELKPKHLDEPRAGQHDSKSQERYEVPHVADPPREPRAPTTVAAGNTDLAEAQLLPCDLRGAHNQFHDRL